MLESVGYATLVIVLLIIAALAGVGYFFWMKIRYRAAKSNEALI